MTILYVTYPGDAATRFDRTYYTREHRPLVMAKWGPYGLGSCAAFWPDDADNGTIAICECRFRDEVAMQAALASPETPEVMADVGRFTDAKQTQCLAGPL